MSDRDETLVRKAQSGERAAFEEIVRRVSRLLFARIFLETGDAHRAEDLVQETLLLAYRSLPRLEDPSHLRSWLLRICHNVVTDDARKGHRQKRGGAVRLGSDGLDQVAEGRPGPAENLERAEERERALAILRSLPEEYREPLTLRYLAGTDYESIGTQLGLTNGALRGLLHRGLKMLRARFDADSRPA